MLCLFKQTNLRRFPLMVVLIAYATMGLGNAQDKPKMDPNEKVTLQYRVARDALAPSQFVTVIDAGISLVLESTWELPKPDKKDKQEAQAKQKVQFDELIRRLETRQINGVEFECRCEWIQERAKLRIRTVPELTPAGRKRIQESGW